jgi:hypothetical protein
MTLQAFFHAISVAGLRDLPIAFAVVVVLHALYLLRTVRLSRERRLRR